jgi:uncharacterized membrane protein YqgA involved in biofilm formation
VTGTFINVAAILAGTLIGVLAGARLAEGLQRRLLAGLGLVTLVIGVDLALAWRDTSALYVLGAVLLGGLAGEALGIEARLARLGRLDVTDVKVGNFLPALLFAPGLVGIVSLFN